VYHYALTKTSKTLTVMQWASPFGVGQSRLAPKQASASLDCPPPAFVPQACITARKTRSQTRLKTGWRNDISINRNVQSQ
jgi:hypothetical protein